MTLYKKTVQEMYQAHVKEFESFREIHDLYKTDQEKYQNKFNEIGKGIMKIVEENERRLCMNMDSGKMGKYSLGLSEKFRNEIKLTYSLLDFVGVTIS